MARPGLAGAVLAGVWAAGGCVADDSGKRKSEEFGEKWRELAGLEADEEVGVGSGARAGGAKGDARGGGWSIVLATFSGAGHAERAREVVSASAQALSGAGVPNVRAESRGRGSAVVAGSYPGPGDARAMRDLESVRRVQGPDGPAFASAFLAPPSGGAEAGEIPRFHLSRAKEEFGPRVRYTLQVAVYESPRREEAMRAAEQATLALRSEGEAAFYYHGPARSMVTIGAFTDEDVRGDAFGRAGSRSLEELRARRPLNLFNGNQPLMERRPGSAEPVAQPSFLVAIPG